MMVVFTKKTCIWFHKTTYCKASKQFFILITVYSSNVDTQDKMWSQNENDEKQAKCLESNIDQPNCSNNTRNTSLNYIHVCLQMSSEQKCHSFRKDACQIKKPIIFSKSDSFLPLIDENREHLTKPIKTKVRPTPQKSDSIVGKRSFLPKIEPGCRKKI